MRLLRFPPVVGAVLLLVLAGAGPAAAQPDHLHLDLDLVRCGTLQASGFELPAGTALDVRFVNPATGATLRRSTMRTGADGSFSLEAKVPLTGVGTVRMTVGRPGAAKPFAFSELTIPGACPLPFTGPARWPTLAGLAMGLLLAGSVLVRLSADRGRHRAGPRLDSTTR